MSAGKGDTPRPVDGDKFRSNYDNIFNKPRCEDCGGKLTNTHKNFFEHGEWEVWACKCGSVFERNCVTHYIKKQTRYDYLK